MRKLRLSYQDYCICLSFYLAIEPMVYLVDAESPTPSQLSELNFAADSIIEYPPDSKSGRPLIL